MLLRLATVTLIVLVLTLGNEQGARVAAQDEDEDVDDALAALLDSDDDEVDAGGDDTHTPHERAQAELIGLVKPIAYNSQQWYHHEGATIKVARMFNQLSLQVRGIPYPTLTRLEDQVARKPYFLMDLVLATINYGSSGVQVNDAEGNAIVLPRGSPCVISRPKLMHDHAQHTYLRDATEHVPDRELQTRIEDTNHVLVALEGQVPADSTDVFGMPCVDKVHPAFKAVFDWQNRLVYRPMRVPKFQSSEVVTEGALGAVHEGLTHNGLAVAKDFFQPEALRALEAFFAKATVWYDVNRYGTLSAYFEDGLLHPILVHTGTALRKYLPDVFGDKIVHPILARKHFGGKNNTLPEGALLDCDYVLLVRVGGGGETLSDTTVYRSASKMEWAGTEQTPEALAVRVPELEGTEDVTVERLPFVRNEAIFMRGDLVHTVGDFPYAGEYQYTPVDVYFGFKAKPNPEVEGSQ